MLDKIVKETHSHIIQLNIKQIIHHLILMMSKLIIMMLKQIIDIILKKKLNLGLL